MKDSTDKIIEKNLEKIRSHMRPTVTRAKVKDIQSWVVWGRIANGYFEKSASWFYNKMNGIDGNGKETDFTEDEIQQLKGALCDLADRIRRVADTL